MCNFYPAHQKPPVIFSVTFLILFTLPRSSFDRKQAVRYCYNMCGRRRQDQRCHKMAVHRQNIHFQRNWCLLFKPTWIYSAYPSHQTDRPPHSLFMSLCFVLLSFCYSSEKTTVTPFHSIGSGERSQASEVQGQLPLKGPWRVTPDMFKQSNKQNLGEFWEPMPSPPIAEHAHDSSHLASHRGGPFPGTTQGSAPQVVIAVEK